MAERNETEHNNTQWSKRYTTMMMDNMFRHTDSITDDHVDHKKNVGHPYHNAYLCLDNNKDLFCFVFIQNGGDFKCKIVSGFEIMGIVIGCCCCLVVCVGKVRDLFWKFETPIIFCPEFTMLDREWEWDRVIVFSDNFVKVTIPVYVCYVRVRVIVINFIGHFKLMRTAPHFQCENYGFFLKKKYLQFYRILKPIEWNWEK